MDESILIPIIESDTRISRNASHAQLSKSDLINESLRTNIPSMHANAYSNVVLDISNDRQFHRSSSNKSLGSKRSLPVPNRQL
jgi:hypothetical protein